MFCMSHRKEEALSQTKQNTYFVGRKPRMRSLADHSQCVFLEDNERNKMKILLRSQYVYAIM